MNQLRSERVVRVYACGGCGANIGQLLETQRATNTLSAANIDTVYLDTSKANLNDAAPEDKVYLLEGLDGSGKIRRENHQEIAKRTNDFLTTFKPLDLNVVIHSASGGSGSVIGPSIVSELINKGHATVVLLVGSADTTLDAQNTLKTLKTYEAISALREAPVVMVYIQNNKKNKREVVNESMSAIVNSLAVLWSGNNRELDSKDLINFLNFPVVTSYEPQLAHLSLMGPEDFTPEMLAGAHILSVATIVRDGQETLIEPVPEVQFVGYVRDDAPKGIIENVPLHFVITDGVFEAADKALNMVLKDSENQQKSRVSRGKILSDVDAPTATGLVL